MASSADLVTNIAAIWPLVATAFVFWLVIINVRPMQDGVVGLFNIVLVAAAAVASLLFWLTWAMVRL